MYIPNSFREARSEVLAEVIRQNSFGTLVSGGGDDLVAAHIPFLYQADRGPHGTLIGHLARANQQWKTLAAGGEALIIFQGPHAYISPAWYVEKDTVPTWNYVAVHAYGTARVVEDPAGLLEIVDALVGTHESGFDRPWSIPRERSYIANLLKAIVGFEIEVTRLEGKFKLSQNRPAADRAGTIAGLLAQADALGIQVAELMKVREAEIG